MRGAWAILRTVDLKEVKQRSYMVMVCFREAPPETFGGDEEGQMGIGGEPGRHIPGERGGGPEPSQASVGAGERGTSQGTGQTWVCGCLESRTEVDSSA